MKAYMTCYILFLSTRLIAQQDDLKPYKQYIKKELSNWTTTFSNFSILDFTKSETVKFGDSTPQKIRGLRSFFSIYKPLLSFSKDSSKFIDIYSYQLNLQKKSNRFVATVDVDQAVDLYDINRNYSRRIYFDGATGWIDDVIFISNTKFILVGIATNTREERVPRILLGDIPKQTIEIFYSSNKSCIQNVKYYSSKLKKMNIKGL